MKLTAVCVGKKGDCCPSPWPDFVTSSSEETIAPRGTIERVRAVAAMRNQAMKQVEKAYPNTTHILMVDTYYLNQKEVIQSLVRAYDDQSIILGASTLVLFDTRLGPPEVRFYDFGTTPEGTQVVDNVFSEKKSGRIHVRAVGACYIFPIQAWRKNGYQCNNDYFEPEHVSLCRGFPTFLSLDHKLWREPVRYPFMKKFRIAAGYYRRQLIHV